MMGETFETMAEEARRELAGYSMAPMEHGPTDRVGVIEVFINRETGETALVGWPDDLSGLHGELLSHWLTSLVGWLDFAEGLLGVADSVRVRAASMARQRRAEVMSASVSTKITDKRLEADADEEYQLLLGIEEEAKRRFKLIDGRRAGIAARREAVSREITRRQSDTRRETPRHLGLR